MPRMELRASISPWDHGRCRGNTKLNSRSCIDSARSQLAPRSDFMAEPQRSQRTLLQQTDITKQTNMKLKTYNSIDSVHQTSWRYELTS